MSTNRNNRIQELAWQLWDRGGQPEGRDFEFWVEAEDLIRKGDDDMSVQVRRRRETAAFLSTFVGAQGELLIDTTNNRVQVHDGATPGGWPAAKLADLPSSSSPLAIAAGGTGATTAPGALAALGAVGRTAVADANYAAVAADRTIAFTSLTAARIVTLPAASAYPTGTQLVVVDESGSCSATNTITLSRTGSDTINGAASATIALPYGFIALVSNGAGKWTLVDQSTASLAQQAASSVAITGGAINGTPVGASTPSTGAFTTLTSTGLAQIGGTSSGAAGSINRISLFGASLLFGFGISPSQLDYVVPSTATHDFWVGATKAVSVSATTLTVPIIAATTSVNLPSYTVATLPAPGTAGRIVYCANARMMTTGGALEAAGAGTGGLVSDNGTAWKLAGTNITASA